MGKNKRSPQLLKAETFENGEDFELCLTEKAEKTRMAAFF